MNISDDLRALPKWTQSAGEELANSISHGMGLHRRADRDADPALGRASARQCRILYRHDRFYFDNVVAVSWIDALPRVAADAREIHFACARSFRHFLADRWDIYAVRAGSASRCWWPHHSRNHLGVRDFWRCHEGDARSIASFKAGDVSLSRDGLVGSDRESSSCLRDSIANIDVAPGRWHRLHNRRLIFCERSPSLQSFCVASVRTYRLGLPFCCRLFLRRVSFTWSKTSRPRSGRKG